MEKIDWEKTTKVLVWWQWAIAVTGVVMGGGMWLFFSKNLPPSVPLFYSLPWGEEQLTNTKFLAIPIILAGLMATVISFTITKLKPDKVLAAILSGAGIITEIILLSAALRIVLLVS